ncbi:PAN domain-containing protein [Rhizobium nepotum]|uniref:PAN domain-containing protein n=1 Tax=Rhizobium nepotum TaxID=1035271 RepID=UPI003CEB5495
MLGTIDPQSALFDDNVDLPGGDLSRRPERSARTPLECRSWACIDDKQCVAFTYIKPKKECWLKRGRSEHPCRAKE